MDRGKVLRLPAHWLASDEQPLATDRAPLPERSATEVRGTEQASEVGVPMREVQAVDEEDGVVR